MTLHASYRINDRSLVMLVTLQLTVFSSKSLANFPSVPMNGPRARWAHPHCYMSILVITVDLFITYRESKVAPLRYDTKPYLQSEGGVLRYMTVSGIISAIVFGLRFWWCPLRFLRSVPDDSSTATHSMNRIPFLPECRLPYKLLGILCAHHQLSPVIPALKHCPPALFSHQQLP